MYRHPQGAQPGFIEGEIRLGDREGHMLVGLLRRRLAFHDRDPHAAPQEERLPR